MFLTPKTLLADQTGTGKTSMSLGLLSMLKAKGHLDNTKRAIIICPAKSVLGSWKADGLDFFTPSLKYALGRQNSRKKRYEVYDDPSWDILLTNYELVRQDIDKLVELNFRYVILDEAHEVRNHETKSAQAVKVLTLRAERVVAMTATPIQNHLLDLHGILDAMGLQHIFGSRQKFEQRHHNYKIYKVPYKGRSIEKKKLVGVKNTEILKKMIEPYYLRRTYKDIDVIAPELTSQVKKIELDPRQKQIYNAVRDEAVREIDEDTPISVIRNKLLRLRQVCSTTATFLPEDHSAKFDWIESQLNGDWQDEKLILFSNWKTSLNAMSKRLEDLGLNYVSVTGSESQSVREERRQTFWNDPSCKVLLGTTAIESSLNLQCARIQVNLDLLWNPFRHGQLAGRIQRVGSQFQQVFVFTLVSPLTIEDHVLKVLERKQALADHMFDEDSTLFSTLDKWELLELIKS